MPGAWARSSGCLKVALGKTRAAVNGGGGSGEPTTREVFQGTRTGGASAALGAGSG